MDIPQLKLLAARVRELLKDASCLVGHSQALDLVAALPGLRNWPEVNAFPDRVAACQLDLAAAGRLAYRLKKKFEFERSGQALLDVLLPAIGAASSARTLEVWPGGPPAGVYLTTSEASIKALLARYEDATDGAVVYAERVGTDHPGSIDLGEWGLWSNGLDRVPSGTLLVLGPVEVDQQSWEDSGKRVEMGCLRAYNERHRVAVLISTPTPETLFEDVRLMVSSVAQHEDTENEAEIIGVVTESGDLEQQPVVGYSVPPPRPPRQARIGAVEALPSAAREPLRDVLSQHNSGLIFCGESEIRSEHTAIDLVVAMLALTEHAGPAARIMPRHRGTPAKDWMVPEQIKALPYLPSIQSAYAQGYRRMVIATNYTKGEMLLDYPDVLFVGNTWGHEVMGVSRLVFGVGQKEPAHLAARLIAAIGVLQLPTNNGPEFVSDLFVARQPVALGTKASYEDVEAYLVGNRELRWEDAVEALMRQGRCSPESLEAALPRNQRLHEHLRSLAKTRKAS